MSEIAAREGAPAVLPSLLSQIRTPVLKGP